MIPPAIPATHDTACPAPAQLSPSRAAAMLTPRSVPRRPLVGRLASGAQPQASPRARRHDPRGPASPNRVDLRRRPTVCSTHGRRRAPSNTADTQWPSPSCPHSRRTCAPTSSQSEKSPSPVKFIACNLAPRQSHDWATLQPSSQLKAARTSPSTASPCSLSPDLGAISNITERGDEATYCSKAFDSCSDPSSCARLRQRPSSRGLERINAPTRCPHRPGLHTRDSGHVLGQLRP